MQRYLFIATCMFLSWIVLDEVGFFDRGKPYIAQEAQR